MEDVESVYGVKPKLRLKKGDVFAACVCNKEVTMDFFRFKRMRIGEFLIGSEKASTVQGIHQGIS